MALAWRGMRMELHLLSATEHQQRRGTQAEDQHGHAAKEHMMRARREREHTIEQAAGQKTSANTGDERTGVSFTTKKGSEEQTSTAAGVWGWNLGHGLPTEPLGNELANSRREARFLKAFINQQFSKVRKSRTIRLCVLS